MTTKPPPRIPSGYTLSEITVAAITGAMRRNNNSRDLAAKELGIAPKTVYNWLARRKGAV